MELTSVQNFTCARIEWGLRSREQLFAADQCLKSQHLEISKDAEILYNLNKRADEGDADAQFELAKKLYSPELRLITPPLSDNYFSLARDESGTVTKLIHHEKGWQYNDGIKVKHEANTAEVYKVEAGKYFKLAADQGHVFAQYNFATMCYFGEGVEADKTEALKYFKLAADQKLMVAQYSYSNMLWHGEGANADQAEATKYRNSLLYDGFHAFFSGTLIIYNEKSTEEV